MENKVKIIGMVFLLIAIKGAQGAEGGQLPPRNHFTILETLIDEVEFPLGIGMDPQEQLRQLSDALSFLQDGELMFVLQELVKKEQRTNRAYIKVKNMILNEINKRQ